MTDTATVKAEPAQIEVVKMDMVTVKPAVARLVPRRRRVTIIVLTPPSRRARPRVWA